MWKSKVTVIVKRRYRRVGQKDDMVLQSLSLWPQRVMLPLLCIIHSFIHLSIHLTKNSTEYLLHPRHCSGHWGHRGEPRQRRDSHHSVIGTGKGPHQAETLGAQRRPPIQAGQSESPKLLLQLRNKNRNLPGFCQVRCEILIMW